MRVQPVADLGALASGVAGDFIRVCVSAQAEGRIPCVTLTGGTGGARVLEALGTHPDRDTVDWARVRFIWGDERWRPVGDAERNDLLADEYLFAHVSVDPALVHRVAGSDSGLTLDDAAAAYARTVDAIERIDIALAGVGEDAHVASLFPGRAEVDYVDPPAALAIRESPKPPPERVTLSLPALNRAAHVWLLAAGSGKTDAVTAIQTPGESLVPAALLTGTHETVLWADTAALGVAHTLDR